MTDFDVTGARNGPETARKHTSWTDFQKSVETLRPRSVVLFSDESADAHGVSRWRRLRVGRFVHRSRPLVLRRVHHPSARARASALRPAFAVARDLFDRA